MTDNIQSSVVKYYINKEMINSDTLDSFTSRILALLAVVVFITLTLPTSDRDETYIPHQVNKLM